MTEEALDQQPGATGVPDTATPAPEAGKPTDQIAEATEQAAAEPLDEADYIIGADDGEAPAAEGEEAEQPEERAPLAPWQPPEGQEISEHAKPHLDALDGIATDEAQRDKLIGLYDQMVQAQTARLAQLNKAAKAELVASLKAELGDEFISFKREVDGAFRALPEELRSALRSARLPDGRLLMGMPEAVRMLHSLRDSQSRHHDWRADRANARDRTTMLKTELDELTALMNRDIDEFRRPWKATGVSGSERVLQISRELMSDGPAPQSAASAAAEMRRLEELKTRDPQMYQFGSWPGARSPADRHFELRQRRRA
jgi:hypothetical protein